MTFRVKTRRKALRAGTPAATLFEVQWDRLWVAFDKYAALDARRWLQ